MRKVVLGKSGLEVSAVGFGGIPIQRISDDEAVAVIRRAMELGVTFIDTASSYGDSQKKIGKAIASRRDGLVIATKSPAKTAEAMNADIERSRSEMGVDVIDLLQLHGVSRAESWEQISAPGGALDALLAARDAGKVAHVGFTSHSLDMAMELLDVDVFETVQFPFNLVTSEPAEALVPKARRRGLGFIVMKPLCGGQYDDADLAFKFLNGFADLVPIPGIQAIAEIEQIVSVVESGATLTGDDQARAERIAAELGKLFCRRCGYCQPCPNGVPITQAMVFDGFLKRFPPEKLAAGVAKSVAEKGTQCIECGECETKCPYELPIMETVKASVAKAQALVQE